MHLAFDDLRRKRTEERLRPVAIKRGDSRADVEIADERRRVRAVLAAIRSDQSDLLLLRAEGYSYAEIASITGVNAASVGTYLARAEQEFRKEYVNRYGELG
jgi:DNA-directed RNA polymerase specialized sigma24 family protein